MEERVVTRVVLCEVIVTLLFRGTQPTSSVLSEKPESRSRGRRLRRVLDFLDVRYQSWSKGRTSQRVGALRGVSSPQLLCQLRLNTVSAPDLLAVLCRHHLSGV